jgi:hypothetical protein
MYFIQPSDMERYALRMLLLYRKGCDSFAKLRTVNNATYSTYRETCRVLGLLDNDNECEVCMEEAITFSTATQLRNLFVLILLNCSPNNPKDLWEKYKKSMSEDILNDIRKRNPEAQFDDDIFNNALNLINDILQKTGNHIGNYTDMPELRPVTVYNINPTNRHIEYLIKEELNYDPIELNKFLIENLPNLNTQQKDIYETIVKRAKNHVQLGENIFFIDGPGGTGKTHVYKMILAAVRSTRSVALAVASSGIAAQLLDGARTAHSRLRIPVALSAESTCNMTVQSDYAKLIQKAELILWDECPMMHRHAFEALDRTLRSIMGNINPKFRNIPFGNKIIVFGGDFRQILPVVKKGTRGAIVNASFNRSKLWQHVQIKKLTENMRVKRLSGTDQQQAQEFAEYLLRIGEGKETKYYDSISGYDDLIMLPEAIASKMSMVELIDHTFPNLRNRFEK